MTTTYRSDLSEALQQPARDAAALDLTVVHYQSGASSNSLNGTRLFASVGGAPVDFFRGDHLVHCNTLDEVLIFLTGYKAARHATVAAFRRHAMGEVVWPSFVPQETPVETSRINPYGPMLTSELIASLHKADPTGTHPVAIRVHSTEPKYRNGYSSEDIEAVNVTPGGHAVELVAAEKLYWID